MQNIAQNISKFFDMCRKRAPLRERIATELMIRNDVAVSGEAPDSGVEVSFIAQRQLSEIFVQDKEASWDLKVCVNNVLFSYEDGLERAPWSAATSSAKFILAENVSTAQKDAFKDALSMGSDWRVGLHIANETMPQIDKDAANFILQEMSDQTSLPKVMTNRMKAGLKAALK